MKKISIALFILVAVVSCKKNDVEEKTAATTPTEAVGVSAKLSGWKTVANTATSRDSYLASITDRFRILPISPAHGLVLVYAKSSTIQLLPAQIEKAYVYYQVSEGAIQIGAASAVVSKPEFSYIIFSNTQLKALEQKGITKSALMKMNYAEVSALKS